MPKEDSNNFCTLPQRFPQEKTNGTLLQSFRLGIEDSDFNSHPQPEGIEPAPSTPSSPDREFAMNADITESDYVAHYHRIAVNKSLSLSQGRYLSPKHKQFTNKQLWCLVVIVLLGIISGISLGVSFGLTHAKLPNIGR